MFTQNSCNFWMLFRMWTRSCNFQSLHKLKMYDTLYLFILTSKVNVDLTNFFPMRWRYDPLNRIKPCFHTQLFHASWTIESENQLILAIANTYKEKEFGGKIKIKWVVDEKKSNHSWFSVTVDRKTYWDHHERCGQYFQSRKCHQHSWSICSNRWTHRRHATRDR